jgi:hypothetical protein
MGAQGTDRTIVVEDGQSPQAAGRKVEHFTRAERAARGKAARAEVPRRVNSEWEPSPHRPDPVDLLEEQGTSRVPELVPIRYGRMLASPFAFYRGGALIMASDLAGTPNSGLRVQLCGDAHLSNFGVFGSPERNLVFDINDFDETAPGPWEWDVKRLATSFAIGGRENGFSDDERRTVVLAMVRSYREAMAGLAGLRNLEVWYSNLPVEQAFREFSAGVDRKRLKKVEADVGKSRTKDSMRAFDKLTRLVDGEPRIISDPPLIVPIDELVPSDSDREVIQEEIRALIRLYRRTLETDRRHLLETFRFADLARKVVGVGSRWHASLDRAVPRRRQRGPAVSAGQGSAALGPRAVRGQERVQQLRPTRCRRPTADASHQRHLPRLAPHHLQPRRPGTRLLCASAQRLERLVCIRSRCPRWRSRVRESMRLDARPCPCPLRRPDGDCQLPRQSRRL